MRTKLLTKTEKQRLEQFRERILTRALSTERCDRQAAQKAYNALLVRIGHQPVDNFTWVDSPYQLHRDQLRVQLRDQLRVQLGVQLWEQLGDQLGDQLRDQLGDQLRDQLGVQLGDQLRVQLWDQLGDQLRDQLDQWQLQYYLWMEYASKLDEIIVDRDKLQTLKLLDQLGEHSFWILPLQDGAVFCDRPIYLERDNEHNLHSETRKAIEFADGWGIYSLHGIRFPDELGAKVISGKLTAKELGEIEDVDQRREALLMMGTDNFLKASKAELVSEGEPHYYEYLPDNMIARFFSNSRPEDGAEIIYRLYKIPAGELYTKEKYILVYDNPSTKDPYMKYVTSWVKKHKTTDPDELIARTFNTTKTKFFAGFSA